MTALTKSGSGTKSGMEQACLTKMSVLYAEQISSGHIYRKKLILHWSTDEEVEH